LFPAFSCNFDNGRLCQGIKQLKDDKFDWTLRKISTPSGGTGPNTDHSGKGYYIYIETSSPRLPGENARLEIKPSLGNGATCISFYYHMLGRDVNELKVLVNGKQQLSKKGSQGDKWNKAEFKVQEKATSVVFEGVRGTSWQGDIAVDDVKIENCGGGGGGGGCGISHRSSSWNFVFLGTPPPPSTPAPPSGSCGIRPSTRIVGGVAAKHGGWPWQAMLRTSSNFPYCGGTLVSPQWVVSAAHCVSGKSASSVFIRLGAHKRTSDVGTEQDFRVSKIITHPSYHQPKRLSHDIALLKLERPAQLNRYVNQACLPHQVNAPTDGKRCWITGWGRLSSGGATPELLQQVSVPIVSRARCDKAYPNKIHDSMICAGLDQGGIDSCQGDSGGPMVCETGGRYYLHGATSWGYGCAAKGKFGVYAKVKYLMSWITNEMKKN
ncbi:unnamed protein product, partial [Porites lobata]